MNGSVPLHKAIVAEASVCAACALGVLVCWSVSDHLTGQSFFNSLSPSTVLKKGISIKLSIVFCTVVTNKYLSTGRIKIENTLRFHLNNKLSLTFSVITFYQQDTEWIWCSVYKFPLTAAMNTQNFYCFSLLVQFSSRTTYTCVKTAVLFLQFTSQPHTLFSASVRNSVLHRLKDVMFLCVVL